MSCARCNGELCGKEPISEWNLVGVVRVLQMDSAVCYPAHFQLAVLPQGCFRGQIPLPAIGLLRAGIEPLVRSASERRSKNATSREASVLISRVVAREARP